MAEQIRYISISSVVLESVVLNKSFNKIVHLYVII